MLNNKMLNILDFLFTSEGSIAIKKICDKLKISKRILLYNVDNLNYMLEKNGFEKIKICSNYLSISLDKQAGMLALLNNMENEYVLDSAERQSLIILCCGLCKESVSLEYLSTLFDVSRNTVISEINKLKPILSKMNISLSTKSRGGYSLSGNELSIRYILMEHIHRVNTNPMKNMISNILLTSACQATHADHFGDYEELIQTIEDVVAHHGSKSQLCFSQSSLHDISLYLLVICLRYAITRKENAFFDREVFENKEIINTAHLIIENLGHWDIIIPKSEGCYIGTILLSAKLAFEQNDETSYNPDLIRLVDDLMDGFEKQAAVSFTQRAVLRSRLLLHLQPMYFRLKFNIYTENPFYKEIIHLYHDLYLITERVVQDVEKSHNISIPTPEIAYLCIYFGSYLANHSIHYEYNHIKILVVCPNGVSTSLLLTNQLQNLLGDDCYIESTDIQELRTKESHLSEYKLIVSTFPLNDYPIDVIQVQTILTENQRDRILNWYLKNANINMSNILDIIQKYASIENKELLITNLQNYLENKNLSSEDINLREVLLPQHLNYCRKKNVSYEDAIALACKPLLQDGKITEKYIKKNIEIFKEFDLYSEIFPGVLLVHARPEDGVNAIGFSITLFENPVIFPQNDNTEIRLLITLAAVNNKQHLNALQQLIYLLQSNGVLDYLFSLNMDETSTNNLYYRLMNQIEDLNLPPID